MSQRLQSIFFFLSALLFALLFFIPIAEYFGELNLGLFRAVKLAQFVKLHKMARIDIIVIVAWIAVVFAYYIRVIGTPIGAEPTFKVGAFLPLPALLLTIAAASGLKKDIKKVRSTDRIR